MIEFRYLKHFLKKNVLRYLVGIFMLIAVDALQLITPLVIGDFTNHLTGNTLLKSDIPLYMLKVIAIAIGVALGRFGWRMTIIKASKEMEYWLRNEVFGHLEKLSLNYYNHHKTGDLMAHATNDINAIRNTFGSGIVMFVDAFFLSIMTIFLMITKVDLNLTLAALLPMPIIVIFVAIFGRLIGEKFQKVQEAFSDLTDNTQEAFSGIRIIKSFAQEANAIKNFNIKNEANFTTNMGTAKIMGFIQPFVRLVAMSSTLIALLYGGSLVIDKTITIGEFVTFFMYVGMITWPMMAMGFVYNTIQRGQVSLKRINAILDEVPEIYDEASDQPMRELNPSIKAHHLNFKYPESSDYALKDISFDIKSGETLAIVGKTGSGKTTLMNLLLKLYNTDEGMLFIGDQDLQTLTTAEIRNLIGYVPQDNFIFSKSVVSNISFGLEVIDYDRSLAAAKTAHVHEEISSLNHGYDALLGERGVNMSGGQKQRLSIARALAKSPKIIMLDDALSAVDTKTEESILTHLKQTLSETTTVISAHRISTIKDADHIIVLDHGQIIEQGTHEFLIKNDNLYANLYQKQLLEEKITGV